MLIYCTGTLTNNGIISMTARGAKAVGQNVYLCRDEQAEYEYVPKTGANGGAASTTHSLSGRHGNGGATGTNRKTGGGGSGGAVEGTGGAGAAGTSYSGGPGGGRTELVEPERREMQTVVQVDKGCQRHLEEE